MVHLTNDAV